MGKSTKTATLLDIAKFKIGNKPYWVAIRPIGSRDIVLTPDDHWICTKPVHPKVLYERGYATGSWKFREKLPKLCAEDFGPFVDILTSDLFVEPFEIVKIDRCTDTGEFIYTSTSTQWIPESLLFSTITQAKREKMRLKKLMKKWANRVLDDRA